MNRYFLTVSAYSAILLIAVACSSGPTSKRQNNPSNPQGGDVAVQDKPPETVVTAPPTTQAQPGAIENALFLELERIVRPAQFTMSFTLDGETQAIDEFQSDIYCEPGLQVTIQARSETVPATPNCSLIINELQLNGKTFARAIDRELAFAQFIEGQSVLFAAVDATSLTVRVVQPGTAQSSDSPRGFEIRLSSQ
jgi:hypothetical protein